MRFFPSAARQQIAVLSVGLVSLAALAVPLAHADDDNDLKHRQKQVEGQIDRAAEDLDEASHDSIRANSALTAALGRLTDARARLDRASDRLLAARELDAELRSDLAVAEQELVVADTELATGQAATSAAQDQLRTTVLRSDNGSLELRAIGSFLNAGSLDDLTRQLAVQDVVIGAGDRAVTQYRRTESALVTQQSDVEAATQAVETRRAAAAAHLVTMLAIYRDAQVAKGDVERLVTSSRAAKQAALRAKQRDRARLQALRQRESTIKQRLLELARQAKARAARSGGGFTGASDGFLSYPANGPVTSPYGYRVHPIYGYYSLHNGTDFGVGCGQPLYAAATGTVIDTYYDSVYGNRLYLNIGVVNGKSLVLIYNHMSGYNAQEGDRVGRGDVVGYVGTTGWSTGCHLHFTVMADGVAVDPMTYL